VGIVGCTVNAPVGGYSNEINPWNLLSRKFDISSYDPWRHELLTTVDFLNFLGCQSHSAEDIWPEFWLSDKDINPLAGYRREGRQIVGLFPGASLAKKCWQPEMYGILAGLLKSEVDFVVFGSPSDVALVSSVEHHVRQEHAGCILNLAGKTTLRELVNAIKLCDLFVGADTSGLHIAVANRIKTIGIVGGAHYGRFVPWGDPNINIYLSKNTGCFHCNWDCKYDRTECIQSVLPDEVALIANRLLG
jgi:ADP-heptose:LPS heptosyltransferase